MAGSVLRAAHIKIHIPPVFVSLAAYQSLAVAGVHIAEVVCR